MPVDVVAIAVIISLLIFSFSVCYYCSLALAHNLTTVLVPLMTNCLLNSVKVPHESANWWNRWIQRSRVGQQRWQRSQVKHQKNLILCRFKFSLSTVPVFHVVLYPLPGLELTCTNHAFQLIWTSDSVMSMLRPVYTISEN